MSLTYAELHSLSEADYTPRDWQHRAMLFYALARTYLEWGPPYLDLARRCQTAGAEYSAKARQLMGLV